jgi:hypothetical protein
MEDIERWTGHSRLSDPAGHVGAIAALPSDIGALNDIIQGVLVHSDWLPEYGLDASRLRATSRQTLPVLERLNDIFERDAQPLQTARPAERRTIGTCRDFALLLCSFLRSKGVPSRLRCGFAAYFGEGWEDHWVCEYWDRPSRSWRLSDPQIDSLLKDRYRIGFDPADVPREAFLTAGEAWRDCRDAGADPVRFGHGEVTGLWFVKINLIRDHHVLNGRETSAWDGWRDAPPSSRRVRDDEISLLDRLAACPEQPLVDLVPDWQA